MKYILTILALAISVAVFGQTIEQREVIKASMKKEIVTKSASQIENYISKRSKRIADYLNANPEKKRTFSKDGKAYLLYNVLPDGTPLYITTKDKNQQTNTKSISLYAGGSLGANISGKDMVAGVWDGGQVNANHETLVGQAGMQSNQDIDEEGGNDHQTAVTGIIVGKLDNNAQGIAYDATTRNYDWDDDIAEMNAFASQGFLISNHSYGYTNDDSMPVWLFGAYDDEARAWDAMLKSKPFYLPFVAGGNEQQDNGNNSAGGFDIITGATASKNVVTVGAVEINNTMSDYSNWGPTDDGRIKPDIVSLGSSIDVPLYADNEGYTGNIEESSGTSYSAPAVAASALLLQQYYYSLNNEYMTAPMLKALLLHSADDDASGNGPDAKFGWGILNVEKAANIIKQNSEGTAKMIMVKTNPNNDGNDEIINNFVFDQGNARASLCWIDDEGIAQNESEGINPTFSNMVYNFSMKFEQNTPSMVSFPYNNLSVINPTAPAVEGTDWFQSANNYLQANLTGTSLNASGKIIIRKDQFSPSAVRDLALIITGLKNESYAITTTALPNEGGSTSGSGTFNFNTSLTVVATANTGYSFVNWTENGTEVSTDASYTFAVTANRNLLANFRLNSFSILTTANPSEGGSTSGSGTFNFNTSATVVATANTGYSFVNWTENGTEVSTDASYTFAVTANRNLLANFRLNSFSILTTANPSEGGSTSGSGTFNFNTSATVVATANTGYSFVNWTENGTEVSTEASYTFAVRANRSLLATFDVLTSIEDYEKFSLNIYPNPGTKTLYVSSPSIQIKQIRIFENSGKLVFVKKYSSNQISINILNLAPGGYFIEISSDRQSFTRKFFKE